MITTNPFAEISPYLSPVVMQSYVVAMILLVIGGTLFDVVHKQSARYFFENWRKSKSKGNRQVGGGEIASLAIKTAAVDVATSAEFCNLKRRIAHLLTMYGFLVYVITTFILVFSYPSNDAPAPATLALLWHIGALMICVGGYWFWFFIRVDVAAEGHSPFRIIRADLFVLSLMASATFALLWSAIQAGEPTWFSNLLFGLFILATTVLFGSVAWSKFAHMFFKPAAALQKRIADADGSRSNLPAPADKPKIFSKPVRQPQNY